jgi:tRNA (guanine-N7-)-methyltransferase
LPELLIDAGEPPPDDCRALFPAAVGEVRLEVGCGAGEHLVNQAARFPDAGFIGVEPFEEGLGKTVAAIDAAGCRNVRLFDDDAAMLLDWLPPDSLSRIDLLYPDPWPKRRHWKRRFVQDATVAQLARILRPGGEFRFVTDIDDYAAWTLVHLLRSPDFAWTAQCADDWRKPWPGFSGTRYQAKAIRAQRAPCFLIFRRR